MIIRGGSALLIAIEVKEQLLFANWPRLLQPVYGDRR